MKKPIDPNLNHFNEDDFFPEAAEKDEICFNISG